MKSNKEKSLGRRLENVYVVPIRSFDNKMGENAFRKQCFKRV